MEETVTLGNQDLTELGPGFGPRFGPRQIVEAVYRSDRSLPIWSEHTDLPGGIMAQVSFENGVKAYGLVYVLATVPRESTNRIEVATIAKAADREQVLETLVHELRHVQHGWLHGGHNRISILSTPRSVIEPVVSTITTYSRGLRLIA